MATCQLCGQAVDFCLCGVVVVTHGPSEPRWRDMAQREWYAGWAAFDTALTLMVPRKRAHQAAAEVFELERIWTMADPHQ